MTSIAVNEGSRDNNWFYAGYYGSCSPNANRIFPRQDSENRLWQEAVFWEERKG
jgi:hypothetical protein